MKTSTASIFFCVLSSVLLSALAVEIPESLRQGGVDDIVASATRKVRDNGCDPNVCFALDGSGSITTRQFELQKDFVELVSAVISTDPEGTYSAVQYGLGLRSITRRPTSNIERFLYAVNGARQIKSSSTFIAPGIANCIRQLRGRRFRGEPKKIVLLGDGQANFDSTLLLSPANLVRRWKNRDSANAVCGVAVNFQSIDDWAAIVGGRRNVVRVGQWERLVYSLEDLVVDVCGWKNLEF